jgi:hypothetical protein
MAAIVVYSVATSTHGNPAEQRDDVEEEEHVTVLNIAYSFR